MVFHSTGGTTRRESSRDGPGLYPCVVETASATQRCRYSLQRLHPSTERRATPQQGIKFTKNSDVEPLNHINLQILKKYQAITLKSAEQSL